MAVYGLMVVSAAVWVYINTAHQVFYPALWLGTILDNFEAID